MLSHCALRLVGNRAVRLTESEMPCAAQPQARTVTVSKVCGCRCGLLISGVQVHYCTDTD